MKKIFFLLFLIVVFFAASRMGLGDYLSFDYLKNHLHELQMSYQNHPLKSIALFFGLYVFVTAISFPGAALLTLLGGAIYGVVMGTLLVSFASTIGATLAFLSARFLFRDFVEKKFSIELQNINLNMKKEGSFYLFTLRLIPLFPFFMINLLMGLTNIGIGNYFLVSQLGMLPATVVFIYAGKNFSEINALSQVLSPKIIISFFLVGFIPYIAKYSMSLYQKWRLYRKFKKPGQFDYNMMVIGGGSAGLVTAYVGSAVKAKVALVEKHKMGGDCLNTGCVPSKALIKTTKTLALKNHADELGLKKIEIDFDFVDVMKRIKKIIAEIEPHDSVNRYEELGVDCLTGTAQILSPFEVKVGEKIYTTQNITIASGASPFIPPIKGIDQVNYLTSDTLWDLKTLPQKFIIIGGGPIGCEIAQAFNRLGSQMVIVEGADHLLSKEDFEASDLIEKQLSREGIDIRLGYQAKEFVSDNNRNILVCESMGKKIELSFDSVLIAIGRKANVKGFGLEELGINLRTNGTIKTNEFLQTNYPNIFACGDVTGPYQLTHMSAHQAWYCAVNGLFGGFKKFKVDYSVVPWCTYTDPEVATVGLNEKALKEKELDYEVTLFNLAELDRSILDSDTFGFVKVMTKKGSDKILGATIVGREASTMILEFVSVMKFKKGLKDILNTIHIYPTMGEANKYVAGVWRKNHAPVKILNLLEKYFVWLRK